MGARSSSAITDDHIAVLGSSRAKIALLGLIMLASVLASLWDLLRREGVGNPEYPARVLVVADRVTSQDELRALGFQAKQRSFEGWEAKALGEDPGLEVHGIAAIVALADRYGYGYVALEDPQGIDWSELPLDEEPEVGDARFAVISVGDLAFPRRVTTGDRLLWVLLEQDVLAEKLEPASLSVLCEDELRARVRDDLRRELPRPLL